VRPWLIVLFSLLAVPAAAQDLDRDGVPDRLEQALLERFAPTLLLTADECDGAPASFEPFAREPRVSAKDGTIYGQAFRAASGHDAVDIELHFFHLWSRDCGRFGHDLDAEHVSAIVSAPSLQSPPSAWSAGVWYAAAHEGSACDASSGAPARAIGAHASGPRVFVSRGKHASYFDRGQCRWGCGADECGDARQLAPSVVINIGEVDAPLNGATWVHSERWPLAKKLASDFSPELRARFDARRDNAIVSLMLRRRAPQAPVLAGDTALDGLATAIVSTRDALATATRAVSRFLRRQ
jgi:hypothetical protein